MLARPQPIHHSKCQPLPKPGLEPFPQLVFYFFPPQVDGSSLGQALIVWMFIVFQVKLTCGKETIVTSTSEPSRCEYLMEFITPAVCQEPPSLDPTPHEHEEL